MNPIDSVNIVSQAVTSHDLSIWGLVVQADFTVKIVMLILFLASFWSWTIIFAKSFAIRRVQRLANKFEEHFWSGKSLDNLYERVGTTPRDPMTTIFAAAMREWRRSISKPKSSYLQNATNILQERVERIMQATMTRELERLEQHLGFLATVGSTAPFIGLFGMVWGVMTSFQSIALMKNATLAVIAPGIAEALLVTALGLVAAIPAVIGYNKIAKDIGRYAGRLELFITEFTAIMSRRLEEES